MLTCEPGQKILFETIVDEINGKQDSIGIGKPGEVLITNSSGTATEWEMFDVDCKVDKITGKGLSTVDVTNELAEEWMTAYRQTHTHTNKYVLDKQNQDPICSSLTYDGIIVGSEKQALTTANGTWLKFNDGTMIINVNLTLEDRDIIDTGLLQAKIDLTSETTYTLGSIENVYVSFQNMNDEIAGNVGMYVANDDVNNIVVNVAGAGAVGSKTDISSLYGTDISVLIYCNVV